MKLCTSSICIFIEVSIKFHSIPTKSRFILIFRPNHAKSQFFFQVRARKSVLTDEFFHDFLHSCLEQKKNIFHKKFEFFDKRRIKYEFLTRLKLKTPKHQPKNWILSCFFADTSIKIHIKDMKFFVVFWLGLNLF